ASASSSSSEGSSEPAASVSVPLPGGTTTTGAAEKKSVWALVNPDEQAQAKPQLQEAAPATAEA
ncbi:hypothetical protein H0H92_005371, partial [Tricholoma furcatifolium]